MFSNFRPVDPMPFVAGLGQVVIAAPTAPEPREANRRYRLGKRMVDVLLGVLLALVLGPIIAVLVILVVLTSPGPAFYRQTRLGQFGRPFVIVKLRTMFHRCEEKSGARWSVPGDNRVTPLGKVLRKLHLDEFPQLWNVLRGDMSLVGPRPERPEFFPVLSASVPHYAQRMLVKPGVTGLAQVFLPPDEDVAGVRRKQLYDLHYIRTISFSMDMRLMAATGLQVIGLPPVVVQWVLRLPRPQIIEAPDSRTYHGP